MADGTIEESATRCWVCGDSNLVLLKPSTLPVQVTSASFRITDADYGSAGAIYGCRSCGFRQCANLTEVLSFYENMDDTSYETTRHARSLQARKLVETLALHKAPASGRTRLLDVGAGSGILLEAAAARGWRAEGVEPSRWLTQKALARGLVVYQGVLPHPDTPGPYDAVTVIDVIEHVSDPVGLMREVRKLLHPDGVALVVTPDVRSVAARLMRWKWWHYRVAHIGYFDRITLAQCMGAAGLECIAWERPSWFFTAHYLAERVLAYVPRGQRLHPPAILKRITLPLNLFDSILVIVRPVKESLEP